MMSFRMIIRNYSNIQMKLIKKNEAKYEIGQFSKGINLSNKIMIKI